MRLENAYGKIIRSCIVLLRCIKMNYREWSKNAHPMCNANSPQITSSTCIRCHKDYERYNLYTDFNVLYCYECLGYLLSNSNPYRR